MAEEITLKVNVETGKAVTNLGNLENATKGVTQATKQADAGAETLEQQFDSLNKEIKEGPVNIRRMNKQIQEYQAIALEAGRTSPLGKKAIAEAAQLKDRYNDITAEVNRLANDGVKMQAALDIGTTVIAGYAAFQGALALAGVDSEKYRETLIKLQGAQSLLMGIETLRKNLEKESTVVLVAKTTAEKIATIGTYLYAAAVGTATGAMKLFRLALIATGIGAIVVGIVALVMNFSKLVRWVKNITGGMGAFGEVVKKTMMIALFPLIAVIEAVKWGLQKLGIIESEEEKAKKKRAQAEYQRRKEESKERKNRLREIEYLAKREEAIRDNKIAGLDNEISIAKSLGKDTIKLEREKLNVIIESTKIQKKLSDERIALQIKEQEALIEYFKMLQAKVVMTKETFKDYNKIIEVHENKITELNEERKKSNQDIKDSETALLVFENNTAKARSDKRKKTNKEILKAETDLSNAKLKQRADDSLDAEEKMNLLVALEYKKLTQTLAINNKKKKADKMSAAELKLLVYNTEQAVDKIREDFAEKERQRKITLAVEEAKRLNELLLSVEDLENAHSNRMTENLEKNRQIEENAIREKYYTQIELLKERNESTKLLEEAQGAEIAEINKKYRQQELQTSLELASQGANALQSLGDAVFSHKMKNLKKGSKEEEAMARKQFKFNKALQLSMAFIDGAKAITSSLAQSPLAIGPIPNPAGIASLAFATITSAAQIATIAAQQFSGGGGGGFSGAGMPNISGGVPQIAPVTNTSTLVPQEDQKVFVTETDISDTQNKVSVIEAQSTF